MALGIGLRLGPYEILSPLGAGGMGEVYRARDTRLDREVAIKVLPERLANDADTMTAILGPRIGAWTTRPPIDRSALAVHHATT
jgi:serine/threonine protein kinase